MSDNLRPLSDPVRRVAALACVPAALVAGALAGLVTAEMIRREQIDFNGKPLWIPAVVCGVHAAASGWMAVRLGVGRSANGVTILPIWFIEVVGLVLLAAAVWLGIEHGMI